MDDAELQRRFIYHPPDEERADRHALVRQWVLGLAGWLNGALPEGREKSLAITHLEEVMFWANAALARDGH